MAADEPRARSAHDTADEPERASDEFFVGAAHEVTLTLTAPSWQDARDALARGTSRSSEHLDAWARDAASFQGVVPWTGDARVDGLADARITDTRIDEHHAEGSVLALVGRARAVVTLDLGAEMAECFALGDFSGALHAAELLLKRDANHAAALHCRDASRTRLESLLRARLLAQGRVPELRADAADRRWLSLDPRVAALLPWLDGVRDYDAVIRDSGVPAIDALRALVELIDVRVVRLV